MNKLKLFFENFLVYGFGGIVNKIIPFIMLIIITKLLPDPSYYGISDMSHTLINFASAICRLGLYEALFRLYFDKDSIEYQKDLCSTVLNIILISSTIMAIILVVFRRSLSILFFEDSSLEYLVCLSALAMFVDGTNAIVSAPTRILNRRKTFLIMNFASSILSYAVAIPLLLRGYYLIALPVASFVAACISETIFWLLNKNWFCLGRINKHYLKALFAYGIPALPSFLVYWIFNSSDKLMITQILGTRETGLYAVGSKMGMVSQLIYMAFSSGWQFFAYSTMKEDNQVKNNSLIFEYLGIVSCAGCLLVCSVSYLVYRMLFSGEYEGTFVIAPYLFCAPLLQMLFQISGTQFGILKKTWPNTLILAFGAILNISCNLLLIPILGIEGAAIATILGYLVADIIEVVVLYKLKMIVIETRFFVGMIITFVYFVFWRNICFQKIYISMPIALICIGVFCVLYKRDLNVLIDTLRGNKKGANEIE